MIDQFYREGFNIGEQKSLEYEIELRNQEILMPKQSIPSVPISKIKGYEDFQKAEKELKEIAKDWRDRELITQKQYNDMIFIGVWGPEEQKQEISKYFSYRFAHKKIIVPWEEVSFFSVR